MKPIILSLFLFVSSHILGQTLFFDDFEETISNDAIFTQWTTENIEGWHYWHIIPWNGNPGQCMRFQNTEVIQNDWLISKPINCAKAENLKVNFSHLFHAQKVPPKLYYTSQYNGHASQSTWKEITYSFGANENQWYQSDDFIIENPGDVIYFAFHYQAAANAGTYFLLDNFSVKSYTPPVPFVLVGNSEHFEFYTNLVGQSDYWQEIKDGLEKSYIKYDGHWNIPGLEDYIDEQRKTKVYFTQTEDIPLNQDDDILTIKSGYFDRDSYSIYLCPLDTEEKLDYYGSLEGLAVNTFAGYAVKHRILRDRWEDYLPPYFIEGFGLYEQGYRPVRDSVISYLQSHPEPLSHDVFIKFKNLLNSSEKDILVAHYQYLQLFQGYKYIYWYHGTLSNPEKKFFYYFYTAPDDIQIKKYDESENFDIYCSSRDIMYIDSMKVWLERTRAFYIDTFQMEIHVRYPLLLMYDEQTGMDLTGYNNFNGGSASICISPHSFWSGLDGYNWLLAHEFGHVFNSLMYAAMPSGFYHEGMANLSGFFMDGGAHLDDQWKIEYVFNYYKNTYNREPTLEEIITNPDAGKPGLEWGIDCYFFGFEFFRFLAEYEGYSKIKAFFNMELDWTVFDHSYEEIEKGYIAYLWKLNSERDYNEPKIIHNTGLTVGKGDAKIIYSSNLQASDQEVDDSKLFYIIETYPTLGKLQNLDKPNTAITRFSESDLKENKIQYISTTNQVSTDYFIFTLTDGTFFPTDFKFNIQIIDSSLPIVSTLDARLNASKKAILYGSATTYSGGTTITQRGFYWSSTNSSPNSGDYVETVTGTTGDYFFQLEGLVSATTYYFRAFATNSEGTAIGEVKQFETLSPTVLADLPFSDDFSQNYQNWTTVSVTGDDVWHISNDDGIDFGKCARFYKISNPGQQNEDWLVSPVFNTTGISNLAITFKYSYAFEGAAPDFYYASTFDGDPANSTWTKIDKEFWISNWGWQDARIEIANPGESFVFAVRYNVAANDSYYFLMDNFSIEAFEPIAFEKIGTTDHFEFYSQTTLGIQYWNEINTQVEDWYAELCSYWDRPGRDSIYQSDAKFKIYLTDKSGVDEQFNANFPEWKYGGYTLQDELFVAVPSGSTNDIYQGSFVKVIKNTLSQLILKKRFLIDGIEGLPDFFSEGFGMYYSGLRADRDSILKAISDLGRYPQLSDIESTAGIDNSYKRDMILSYIEAQTLSSNGIQWIFPGPYKERWENHFLYYFEKEEDERMRVRKETPRFNIYSTQKDEKYLDLIGDKLEEKLSIYEDTYKHEILHRINCVVYPNSEAGVHCLVVMGRYNGGSGWSGDLLDILSPDYFGLEGALDFLIPHEFFHVYHFNIVRHLFQVPSFFSEGLANFMAAGPIDAQHKDDIWKLEPTFKYYYTKFSRDPNLEELMSSEPDPETGYSNDPYFFGELFYNYLYPNLDEFSVLKDFFGNDQDWSVLPLSYEEIDHEYIKYLKGLARIIPVDTCYTLPFYEPFTNFDNGWTKPSIHNPDNWQIDDGGTNGTNCARFYTSSDKNVPIESWLISPPIDAGENDEVKFSFDFARFGEGIELDVFYTNKFEGYTDNANWTSVKSIEMPTDWNWSNSGEISINNPPDSLFIGLRKKSSGEQHLQLYIDNFNVDGTKSISKLVSMQEKDFKICPNPITTESIISFQTKNNDKVKLAVYDIQGRKICTLLDERLNAGTHTIKIENQIRTNGVYLCKLATSEGVSTLKLFVNSN